LVLLSFTMPCSYNQGHNFYLKLHRLFFLN